MNHGGGAPPPFRDELKSMAILSNHSKRLRLRLCESIQDTRLDEFQTIHAELQRNKSNS